MIPIQKGGIPWHPAIPSCRPQAVDPCQGSLALGGIVHTDPGTHRMNQDGRALLPGQPHSVCVSYTARSPRSSGRRTWPALCFFIGRASPDTVRQLASQVGQSPTYRPPVYNDATTGSLYTEGLSAPAVGFAITMAPSPRAGSSTRCNRPEYRRGCCRGCMLKVSATL